jgi:hypothetical protein
MALFLAGRRLTSRRALVAALALTLIALVAPAAPAAAHRHHPVHAARAATHRFEHVPAARRAGYTLLKDADHIACIARAPAGGMGVHYVQGSLVDAKLSVRHPEVLVYRFTSNGHLRLAALEYVVLRDVWRQAHGPHAPRPRLFGHRFNFTPAGNRFGLPAYYSLHAWVWYHNPAGRFAPYNPRVHCPRGI